MFYWRLHTKRISKYKSSIRGITIGDNRLTFNERRNFSPSDQLSRFSFYPLSFYLYLSVQKQSLEYTVGLSSPKYGVVSFVLFPIVNFQPISW